MEICDKCGGECKQMDHNFNVPMANICSLCGCEFYECYDCFLDLFEMPLYEFNEEMIYCKKCRRDKKIDDIIYV